MNYLTKDEFERLAELDNIEIIEIIEVDDITFYLDKVIHNDVTKYAISLHEICIAMFENQKQAEIYLRHIVDGLTNRA